MAERRNAGPEPDPNERPGIRRVQRAKRSGTGVGYPTGGLDCFEGPDNARRKGTLSWPKLGLALSAAQRGGAGGTAFEQSPLYGAFGDRSIKRWLPSSSFRLLMMIGLPGSRARAFDRSRRAVTKLPRSMYE